MLLKYLGAFLLMMLVTISNSYPTKAQGLDSARKNGPLATRLIKDVALEGQLWDLLGRLSLNYDIPLGLEISPDEQLSNRYRVELSEGTVADLMSQIIKQNKRYDWSIENGVVNIFPRDKHRDPFLAKLLTVRIRSFVIDKNSDCLKFQNDLVHTPEIMAALNANRIQSMDLSPNGFYLPQLGVDFSLRVSDITLKALLNRVISESPLARTWIISTDTPSRILNLRVASRPLEKSQ